MQSGIAQKFRDIVWWVHERERVAAEINPHTGNPLDLNALFRIRSACCARDCSRAGRSGCGRIGACGGRFGASRSRRNNSAWAGRKLKPVAVFRFLSEDWSPWIALARMRERWPGLRFVMKAGYLE